MKLLASFICSLLLAAVAGPAFAQSAAPQDPRVLLARAKAAMGAERIGDKVLHLRGVRSNLHNYESDRTYSPFLSTFAILDRWFDPQSGRERSEGHMVNPRGDIPLPAALDDAEGGFVIRGGKPTPIPRRSPTDRGLNAWAVVADWAKSSDVRFVGHEMYRDYPRIVLARTTADGEQRLFLDEKTGFPVKLDFVEPHYLWGQQHVEYVYSNWEFFASESFRLPTTSFRVTDGEVEISQTLSVAEFVERKTVPDLSMPQSEGPAPELAMFLRPIKPTVTKISDNTYLLSNPGYNEVITRVGNEVYVLDATQGEERARQDHEIIRNLFPGTHRIFVVVTDLAWPHVAGVRYWVAAGATIVAHRAGREFLQRVIDRRWTLAPDLLERSRRSAHFNFVAVGERYATVGEGLGLYAIDGIGSEVALMAYLPRERFLWASDYIQTVEEPTQYADEVWAAAKREHLAPEQVAAEHLPLTAWKTVAELQSKEKNGV